MKRCKMTAHEADMIAWLASPENRDAELRAQAKDILDTLAFMEYQRRIGRGTPISPKGAK